MSTVKQPTNTRIVFFGNERLATGVNTDAPTLRRLIAGGYQVVAVVSHHGDTRSRQARQLEIASVATEHNIPVLLPEKPAEIIDQLREYHADIAVLAAYGKIVPQSIIDVFPHGIINIHPSLLPLHRGPIPIESVILEGAGATGVSIMQLVRDMDAGPVYGQQSLSLSGSETKQQLADALLNIGGELLIKVLPGILDGSCQPQPQDSAQATYDALIHKQDGMLDFTKPAERLVREVRAYQSWPKSHALLFGKDVIVTDAHAAEETPEDDKPLNEPGSVWRNGKQLGVYTSSGIFIIDSLIPIGKKEMSAASFLAGYASP